MKIFNASKTRMIGLPYGEKNFDDMLSRFHLVPERNGQTDGQTDRFAISISRVSIMLTRDKNFKNSPNILKSKLRKSVPQFFCVLAHRSLRAKFSENQRNTV